MCEKWVFFFLFMAKKSGYKWDSVNVAARYLLFGIGFVIERIFTCNTNSKTQRSKIHSKVYGSSYFISENINLNDESFRVIEIIHIPKQLISGSICSVFAAFGSPLRYLLRFCQLCAIFSKVINRETSFGCKIELDKKEFISFGIFTHLFCAIACMPRQQ